MQIESNRFKSGIESLVIMQTTFIFLGCLIYAQPVIAKVSCSNATYSYSSYSIDTFERYKSYVIELTNLARVPFDKYYEGAIQMICNGDKKGLLGHIDNGYVKQDAVNRLIRNLTGHKITGEIQKRRTTLGRIYSESRKKFGSMGLCEACADNVAQWYSRTGNRSACGRLATRALSGSKSAINELRRFPEYCQWDY